MLYLEDYLEMIEHLPQELRDRFTEIRELDLNVQNNVDAIDRNARSFFQQAKRGELEDDVIEAEKYKIRFEYLKVLDDSDEKISIASQVHDLVVRYLRRLDAELFKFKCELEADNNGITEILEKRSLEMDNNSSASTALLNAIGVNQKENRYYGSTSISSHNNHSIIGIPGGMSLPATSNSTTKDNRYRSTKSEKRRDSNTTIAIVPEKRPTLHNNITPTTPIVRPVTPAAHTVLNPPTITTPNIATTAVGYNLQQLNNSGSNAIAVAASQAIVATQQMQQGRRTASLKASYEAIHGGTGPPEFWINRDIANAATAAAQTAITPTNSERKHKKKLNTSHPYTAVIGNNVTPTSTISLTSSSSSSSSSVDMLPATAVTAGPSSISHLGLSSITNTVPNITSNSRAGSASSSTASSIALISDSLPVTDNGLSVDQLQDADWTYDPNEPRYCTCNQVSYGDMVACDNDACPYEWFHYPCVGITQPPKGKWYCPKCTTSMRRRGGRKN